MKLIVQIPAFNEENTILQAIDDVKSNLSPLPKGINSFEIIVINDGSTDQTSAFVRNNSEANIIDLPNHQGISSAFKQGLIESIKLDGDIIVNYDADLQYYGKQINLLVEPILTNNAGMVIGDRQIAKIARYPRYKLISQILGNIFISTLFHTKILDATSGFRALPKETAKILVKLMQNKYTYTIESICLFLHSKKSIHFVPIEIRNTTRKSRLITSKIYYVLQFIKTVLKYYIRTNSKS